MIFVHASRRIRDDLRDEFVQFMKAYVERTRTESGNLTFELTADLDEPATFTMVECWHGEQSVRDHFGQDYVTDFRDRREHFEMAITGRVIVGDDAEPLHDWLQRITTPSAG
jgi:quinol monooxygenase YgiN